MEHLKQGLQWSEKTYKRKMDNNNAMFHLRLNYILLLSWYALE